MNKLCHFCLSCVAFLYGFSSLGQENHVAIFQNNTYFVSSIGGSYVSLLDEGISPLLYNGIGGGANLGHFHDGKRSLNMSSTTFNFNNPSSSISNAEMYTFRLEGQYQQFWKVENQNDKKWKIRPGFNFTAKWAMRNHLNYTNNSQHIETRFAIAPAVMITRPFQLWNRSFEVGAFTNIPLLTYATRPLFASTRFPASVNKEEIEFFDYLKEGEIVSFGKYFKWSAQYYLYYHLANGNGLRLDYQWSYESYRAQNPIMTAEHSIMISTFFRI